MPALAVRKDSLRDEVAVHVAFVALNIETKLFRVAFKDGAHVKLFLPIVLMLVDQIVHLPKLALQSGGFSGCRGGQRVLVRRHERKLAKSDLQLIAKLRFHLFEYRVRNPARRTLEITKLLDLDRRIRWPKYVRRICSRNALNDRRFLLLSDW